MRDPKRIPKVLESIQDLWERFPNMRLTQLLYNISDVPNPTFYYMEDEKLLENLKKLYPDQEEKC